MVDEPNVAGASAAVPPAACAPALAASRTTAARPATHAPADRRRCVPADDPGTGFTVCSNMCDPKTWWRSIHVNPLPHPGQCAPALRERLALLPQPTHWKVFRDSLMRTATGRCIMRFFVSLYPQQRI